MVESDLRKSVAAGLRAGGAWGVKSTTALQLGRYGYRCAGTEKLSQNWCQLVNRATEGGDIPRVARTLHVRVAKRQEARVENIL